MSAAPAGSSPRRVGWPSREQLYLYGPTLAVVAAGLVVAFFFVKPAPPSRIVMATGRTDGAYYQFGLRYRELLTAQGVTLDVRETSGAAENVALLADPRSGVDIAFVQGGVRGPAKEGDLVSLASVYLEPLWVFTRGAPIASDVRQLAGKRLAVGPEGSGTRVLAELVLTANGLGPVDATRLPATGTEAAQALERGEVDAVFLVSSPRSAALRALAEQRGTALMSFGRAEAYPRLYPFLTRVTLPEGTLGLAADIPPRETALVAVAAALVVRPDFHPALSDLVLSAAARIQGGPGIFERRGEFPSPDHVDFPLSEDARRHFQNGPPFLSRYLPFWMATLVDRLKVLLVPLIALLFPLLKVVPPTYHWRVQSKIDRWYREIQTVDRALAEHPDAGDRKRLAQELDRVEQEVRRLEVPLSYARAAYELRLHIDYVRSEIADADRPRA